MNLKCNSCLQELPLEKFSKKSKSTRGYSYKCKDCHNKYVRTVWYVKNKEKHIQSVTKWKSNNSDKVLATCYNTTEDIIKELKKNNTCAICSKKVKLNVDHDHVTGKVRGLLCQNCNLGLGRFMDNPNLLEKAVQYLNNAGGRSV